MNGYYRWSTRAMLKWLPVFVIFSLLASFAGPASTAQATFPSTDNGLIAFVSDRDNHNNDIYVMDPGTGAQARLTNDPASDLDPAWSPDGTKIAFSSSRSGSFELFILNVETGITTGPLIPRSFLTRTTGSNDRQPSWTPDGTRLYFTSDRSGTKLNPG